MSTDIETKKCSKGQDFLFRIDNGNPIPVECVNRFNGQSGDFCLLTIRGKGMARCELSQGVDQKKSAV